MSYTAYIDGIFAFVLALLATVVIGLYLIGR
jgi:hypothetical protein